MSGEATWAVVPVKSLTHVKQRLAAVLPLEARRRLMLTMLQDVLATLRRVDELHPVLVVTPDLYVAEIAEDYGAHVLREPESRGHSAAAIAGFAEARARGAARALTIPADAPLVTPAELRAVLGTQRVSPSPRSRGEGRGEGRPHAPPPRLTLVPSHDGDGTNAILVSPPDAFAPSFGPASFARHTAQAEAAGIAYGTLALPGLGLDIDEPRDLMRLIEAKQGDPRYRFLRAHVGGALEATEHP
jgi:2-phospho-L-lactate/phosphoenolpyruvate guanylyltransferase